MDKSEIFRVCLSIYNMDYDSVMGGVEEMFCENFLQPSIDVCGLIKPWPFLIRSHSFTENERVKENGEYKSYRGLKYCYDKPEDMAYPYLINGKYDENTDSDEMYIYFAEENPRVDYVKTLTEHDLKDIPNLYGMLIASQLAIQIGPMIASDSNAISKAATLYQMYQAALTEAYIKVKRKKNPKRDWFVI